MLLTTKEIAWALICAVWAAVFSGWFAAGNGGGAPVVVAWIGAAGIVWTGYLAWKGPRDAGDGEAGV